MRTNPCCPSLSGIGTCSQASSLQKTTKGMQLLGKNGKNRRAPLHKRAHWADIFSKFQHSWSHQLVTILLPLIIAGGTILVSSCAPKIQETALSASFESVEESRPLSTWLELPPVFTNLAGDPIVQVIPSSQIQSPAVTVVSGFRGGWNRVELRVPAGSQPLHWKKALARQVMTSFHAEHLSTQASDRFELGHLTPRELIATGVKRLLGQQERNPLANAWWNVRMAPPSQSDSDPYRSGYLMFVSNNIGPYDHFRVGHVSVGIRRLQGSPAEDFVLDFRAPTEKDYESSILKLILGDETLINGIRVYNFWDWIHVQTIKRKVNVYANAYRLTNDQVLLLQDYTRWPEEYTPGPFTLLRNNCAALSLVLFDAILPLDQPLRRSLSPVALPRNVVKEVRARFPRVAEVTFAAESGLLEEKKTPPFVIEALANRQRFSSFRDYLHFEESSL